MCFSRQLLSEKWQHVLVTDIHIDGCTVSLKSREWSYIAPLYFYDGVEHSDMLALKWGSKGIKFVNFTDNFIKKYIEKLSFQPAP